MRLSKLLALSLGISRRQADILIEQGKINVNGSTAQLGQQITGDEIIIANGKKVTTGIEPEYIMLHKPVGYVCSRKQQGSTPTIYQLLPKKYYHLHPVGRLDKDSSGLLLLTNDGDFTLRMTHPRYKKEKSYQIELNRPLTAKDQQKIKAGIILPDGISKLQLHPRDSNQYAWDVRMHEGRNRQIRRTFAALDYTVTKLHRIKFGDFSLDDLASGEYKNFNLS